MYQLQIRVNGHKVDSLVDTGSACTLVHSSVVKRFLINTQTVEDLIFRGFAGRSVTMNQIATITVKIQNVIADVHSFVIPDEYTAYDVILGRDFILYKCVQQCSNYNKSSRLKNWKDTSVCEMYGFLCISMLMPRSKKLSLKEYWSTDELLKSGIFRKIMSRDRYMMLLQMLHFNDSTTATDDPLVKLRPVIDSIKTSFSKSFVPYENLCIDESLLLYKEPIIY